MSAKTGWNAFKIGMRTTKTLLAVGIVLTLFELLHRQPAVLAALSAVHAMQQDHETSLTFGKRRIFGNTTGVIIATIIAEIGLSFGWDHSLFRIIGGVMGVLAIIIVCNALDMTNSVLNSTATFFVVLLNTPSSHLFNYGFNRILDTLIGALIAIAVNRLLPRNKH